MNDKAKPTRTDLLRVIGHLQYLIEHAKNTANNDRDPNRAARTQEALRLAHELCLEARSYDDVPRRKSSGGWNFENKDIRAV